ncbi:hypothetical protein DL769_009125 [Monosporascus sp. CRB-8-3]|nr:hypothetical protein DL769_009125 [Monosporascus sp. CRB-8-3]
MSPPPVPTPSLDIPPSSNTVKVSIIDSTTQMTGIPAASFFEPAINGFEKFSGCSYSFLIEHEPSGDKLLFDLGTRKDVENHAAAVVQMLEAAKGTPSLKVEKNVSDILEENGVELGAVTDIIWSHRHFDHTGDPSVFPASTNLVVGPGFRDAIGEGYPQKEDSVCTSSAWEGRNLIELDFATDRRATRVGGWDAVDWFGDGSFYVLHSTGHTNEHLCGLARTKLAAHSSSSGKDEFILMAGDVCHHVGEYRPSRFRPIPDEISPDPRRPPFAGGVCPGECHARRNMRHEGDDRWREAFFVPRANYSDNHELALRSVSVLQEFDAQDNILVVFAHDNTLYDVVELYPKDATDWKDKGWQQEGRWRFLEDFAQA